jgi:hypothetical protein
VLEQLESARRRLSPTQGELQQAALAARRRDAETEARRAAAESAAATERDRRTQALADLGAILDDAADLVLEALPDAWCGRSPEGVWVAELNSAGISIRVWSSTPLAEEPPRPDPLVAAGDIRPRRSASRDEQPPMANIVCEANATGRLRGYRSDWAEFSAWCRDHRRNPIPASATTIANYLTPSPGWARRSAR